MSEPEKGLSYVPQIRQAYKNLKDTQASKLQLALKLGKLLIDAKQTICTDASGAELPEKSSHGKWMKFREEHFSEISHSTANVYMALAKDWARYYEANPDEAGNSQHAVNLVAEGDVSIRAAIQKMREAKGGGFKTEEERLNAEQERTKAAVEKERKKKEREEKAKKQKAELDALKKAAAKSDPHAVLAEMAADEAVAIIQKEWEPDKRQSLFSEQLKSALPHFLASTLIEIWKDDDVKELVTTLTDLLNKKVTPTPGTLRRPVQLEART